MNISIITLFPEMFDGPFGHSIVKRALEKKAVSITFVPLRNFATDAYGSVDDRPYGGGHGMILRVDIVDAAISYAKTLHTHTPRIILIDAQGEPYKQSKAVSLSGSGHLIFICGHYEGVDERVRLLADEEISIGDYILTGGEIPAMVIVDSVIRLLPGVLSKSEATRDESFSGTTSGLEHAQYTRPDVYKDMKVPDILLSGHHAKITGWRKQESEDKTRKRRPDLLRK